ncbi:MAG: DUF423 domain-containing protein [Anaerolineae bacterium]|nr:DUF423 domain-containing protein [Anaerolineae bacterium]
MHRTFLIIAAILGAVGVTLGAFGAHGLAAVFEANGRAATYDTAVQYHLIHALALFGIGILAERYHHRFLRWAGWLFLAGVILFSGSLYILAIFDVSIMGAIAPLGGTAFIVGWLLMGLAVWQS